MPNVSAISFGLRSSSCKTRHIIACLMGKADIAASRMSASCFLSRSWSASGAAPRRKQQRLHLGPVQHLPTLLRAQRVPVQAQVPLSAQDSVVGVEQVACHLLHPFALRIPHQPHTKRRLGFGTAPLRTSVVDWLAAKAGGGPPVVLNPTFVEASRRVSSSGQRRIRPGSWFIGRRRPARRSPSGRVSIRPARAIRALRAEVFHAGAGYRLALPARRLTP